MNSLRGVLILAVLSLSLAACTKTEKEIVYQNPPDDALRTFSTATCAKKNCIKIEKSSLNKTFLLLISGKSTGATPQWMDLKPSVVIFQQSAVQVGLFALTPHSVYGADDSKELIQSFDVLGEDSTSVTFDWGSGFSSLNVEEAFDTELDMGDALKRSSIKVLSSFINNVRVSSELIEINQAAKIQETLLSQHRDNPFDDKEIPQSRLDTVESYYNVSIQLLPYKVDPTFLPKNADKSRTVGFFVTKKAVPEVGSETQFLITKWNFTGAKGPVCFLMTPNTPKEYQDAVREGILYWNKVLGFEALTVEMAKDDRSVPPIHSVMVRWIPWEDAGFAYAQAQADPMTGEFLRGQIFLTPAFAHTKGYVKKIAPVINPLVACDFSKTFSKGDVAPSNALELRIAQDSIRGVVAHETGHALGLRHNFAGSASVGINQRGILKATADYLAEATHPGAMAASTVMDYLLSTENVLVGKYIQNNALPYDQMAMRWAYASDAKDLNPIILAYCSDEDIEIAQKRDKLEIYDCRRHDPAGSSLMALINGQVRLRQTILQRKYEDILAAVFPAGEVVSVGSLDRILNNNHPDLKFEALQKQIGYHKNHVGLISLEKWKNEAQRNLKMDGDPELDHLLKVDLEEVGGFAGAKTLLSPISSSWTATDLQFVLDGINKGQGRIKGRDYQLTTTQQTRLTQYFREEAADVEVRTEKQLNEMFTGL